MDAPFPFGFPPATAVYLTLYVLTLIIHAVFMNYVVAGTGYVAVARLLAARRSGGEPGPLADTLVDWLPFLLGAAITAGVAPLLFVQVLYRQEFYTANLLLFHRWMAILPVLIVGFYLLYLCKSSAAAHWPGPVRALIALGALACVCFTGYSWTENHVLSRQNAETWSAFYASGATVYRNPEIVARLAVWLTGSIPTMVLLVAWQTWYRERMESPAIAERCTRHMAVLAIAGLALAAAGASAFYIGATESAPA